MRPLSTEVQLGLPDLRMRVPRFAFLLIARKTNLYRIIFMFLIS